MARMVLPVPARPSRAIDRDVGVEQQLEGESLLLAPRPQAPRFGHRLRQQDELVVDTSHERRLRTAPQHGELVLAQRDRRGQCVGEHRVGGDRSGRIQAVDRLVRGVDRGPADRRPEMVRPCEPMLGRAHSEVGGLDAQRGVVADHGGRAEVGLADRRADDAVVGHRRIEAVLDEEVATDVVDLDLDGAVPLPVETGWASEPPCLTRSSSIVRSAVRAARPTSSGRVLSPSSSSTTVSGTITSTSSNSSTHVGSAINTDVSSTSRVRCPVARSVARSPPCRASEPVGLAVRSAVGSPVDGSRSVNVTPRRMDRDGRAERFECATGSVVADARGTMVDGARAGRW